MSVKWFDPISERWHSMPEPPEPVHILDFGESQEAMALRQAANECLWRALVASATSTHMSEDEEGS